VYNCALRKSKGFQQVLEKPKLNKNILMKQIGKDTKNNLSAFFFPLKTVAKNERR